MSSSLSLVRSALVKSFVDGAFFPAANIQWENVPFVPPVGLPWAAVWFMPAQPVVATLGSGGQDMVDGIFQVDLNYPLGGGDAEIGAKYDALKNLYKAGLRPSYGGQEVIVRACGRSQSQVIDGFCRCSVTVTFYAHINR